MKITYSVARAYAEKIFKPRDLISVMIIRFDIFKVADVLAYKDFVSASQCK